MNIKAEHPSTKYSRRAHNHRQGHHLESRSRPHLVRLARDEEGLPHLEHFGRPPTHSRLHSQIHHGLRFGVGLRPRRLDEPLAQPTHHSQSRHRRSRRCASAFPAWRRHQRPWPVDDGTRPGCCGLGCLRRFGVSLLEQEKLDRG